VIGNLQDRGFLPRDLKAAGVPLEGLPDVAELAAMDGTALYNPREVRAEDILPYLKNAYGAK